MSFYKELTSDQKSEGVIDIRDRTSWKKTKLIELDIYLKELQKKQVPYCRTCMVNEIDRVFKRLKEAKSEAITMGKSATINMSSIAKVDFEQFVGLYNEKENKGCMILIGEKQIANKSKGTNALLTVENVMFRDFKCKKGHGISFEVAKGKP